MARVARISRRFSSRLDALGIKRGSPTAAAIGVTINALSSDPLPGPQDYETLMPPVVNAWVRRVPSHNLWILFDFSDTELDIVSLTSRPPIPL